MRTPAARAAAKRRPAACPAAAAAPSIGRMEPRCQRDDPPPKSPSNACTPPARTRLVRGAGGATRIGGSMREARAPMDYCDALPLDVYSHECGWSGCAPEKSIRPRMWRRRSNCACPLHLRVMTRHDAVMMHWSQWIAPCAGFLGCNCARGVRMGAYAPARGAAAGFRARSQPCRSMGAAQPCGIMCAHRRQHEREHPAAWNAAADAPTTPAEMHIMLGQRAGASARAGSAHRLSTAAAQGRRYYRDTHVVRMSTHL